MAERGRHDAQAVLHDLGGAESATYRARARRLGLPFVAHVDPGPDALTSLDAISMGKVAKSMAGELIIAPDEEAMPETIHWLNTYPAARRRICVSTPTAIRAALREAGSGDFLTEAIGRIESTDRDLSAQRSFTRWQATIGTAGLAALATVG